MDGDAHAVAAHITSPVHEVPTMSISAPLRPDAAQPDPTLRRRVTIPVEPVTPVPSDELVFSNPLRAPDTIRFRLAIAGSTRIELTALTGRHGLILLDAPLRAGWHSVALPDSIVPGTWFVRLRTAAGRITAMLVVTR
jgi:hypothetical protein